jgi:hypothetical protein
LNELGGLIREHGSMYLFDTIRQPGKDSFLLRQLMNLDQGKYIRDEQRYRDLIRTVSGGLKIADTKVIQITGAFMPQPAYFYAEFTKGNRNV